MNESKLRSMISAAVHLDRELAEKTETLKAIKAQLIDEALTRSDEHRGTDGGGKSWEGSGDDGCIARVTWPAPSLKSSIDAQKPAGAKVMDLVGRNKDQLFTPVLRYVPVENFRDRVFELFPAPAARKLIRQCETATPPKVSFETKDPV